MNKILSLIKKEIKKNILLKYSFIKDYKIEKIYRPQQDYLAWYRHNSIFNNKGIPIIRLNIPIINDSTKGEYIGLSLYDVLLTTILHELGHAIQEYNGGMGYYDEAEAESFAYFYWDFGQVLEIKKYNKKTCYGKVYSV